jgi:hypothetical protein
MEGTEFDEIEFFRRIGESGARALLIGRRALVALGLPVLTADYDFSIGGAACTRRDREHPRTRALVLPALTPRQRVDWPTYAKPTRAGRALAKAEARG